MAFLGEENGAELAVTSACVRVCVYVCVRWWGALGFTWKAPITENKGRRGLSAFSQLLQRTMIGLLATDENVLN